MSISITRLDEFNYNFYQSAIVQDISKPAQEYYFVGGVPSGELLWATAPSNLPTPKWSSFNRVFPKYRGLGNNAFVLFSTPQGVICGSVLESNIQLASSSDDFKTLVNMPLPSDYNFDVSHIEVVKFPNMSNHGLTLVTGYDERHGNTSYENLFSFTSWPPDVGSVTWNNWGKGRHKPTFAFGKKTVWAFMNDGRNISYSWAYAADLRNFGAWHSMGSTGSTYPVSAPVAITVNSAMDQPLIAVFCRTEDQSLYYQYQFEVDGNFNGTWKKVDSVFITADPVLVLYGNVAVLILNYKGQLGWAYYWLKEDRISHRGYIDINDVKQVSGIIMNLSEFPDDPSLVIYATQDNRMVRQIIIPLFHNQGSKG